MKSIRCGTPVELSRSPELKGYSALRRIPLSVRKNIDTARSYCCSAQLIYVGLVINMVLAYRSVAPVPGAYRSTLDEDGTPCAACPQGTWSKNWELRLVEFICPTRE